MCIYSVNEEALLAITGANAHFLGSKWILFRASGPAVHLHTACSGRHSRPGKHTELQSNVNAIVCLLAAVIHQHKCMQKMHVWQSVLLCLQPPPCNCAQDLDLEAISNAGGPPLDSPEAVVLCLRLQTGRVRGPALRLSSSLAG